MAGYSPLKITGMSTGLVQQREQFILPDDAYPQLQNAYVWRERILRKKGYKLLGRLQKNIGTTNGAGNLTVTIDPHPLQAGIASFTIGTNLFNDPGGVSPVTLNTSGPGTAVLDRATGILTITGSNAATAVQYFPGLPVMGIRTRELQNSTTDQTVFFDQSYAYVYNNATMQFVEFLPANPATWQAKSNDPSSTYFFWSTNYWVSEATIPNTAPPVAFFGTSNRKIFWVTNNSAAEAVPDPIRITDGTTWVDFVPPNFGQIDATTWLVGCLSFLPFRGRMLAFNTWEGGTALGSISGSVNFSNRIRWSTIGNPFIAFSAAAPGSPARGSWRDDIRGQGGFLDIPTSEDIVSVGFVRDNLVIYCERSTWQLRYTGRSIAPFQIEKVNSELGGEGPFSAVQFDTSLVGIGDKGIVECDSYKSERIDIKIPDFVFNFQPSTAANLAAYRVHGIRDFINRLAYWTVPLASSYQSTLPSASRIFPNQRLVYNYENDSWALFNDSLTTLGTYQPQSGRTWKNTHAPWIACKFPWISTQQAGVPAIVGGNQQGFIEYLNQLTTNDVSLFISQITPNTATVPTIITSPNHNMMTGFVIQISGIPTATPYAASLNGKVFGIVFVDANNFQLWTYNSTTGQFSDPANFSEGPYVGGGLINIRENFSVVSKKFNFLDEGQNIQLGYIDILMNATEKTGAISLFVYLNYDGNVVSNTKPQNEINDYSPIRNPDTFFNSVIPTTQSSLSNIEGSKFWQRVYCSTRANFLTLQYTFSNGQMAGVEQERDVQIDAQILWIRKAGRMTSI